MMGVGGAVAQWRWLAIRILHSHHCPETHLGSCLTDVMVPCMPPCPIREPPRLDIVVPYGAHTTDPLALNRYRESKLPGAFNADTTYPLALNRYPESKLPGAFNAVFLDRFK